MSTPGVLERPRVFRAGPISFRWRLRGVIVGCAVWMVALGCMTGVMCSGTFPLSPAEVFAGLLAGPDGGGSSFVIFELRAPRALTGLAVGAVLGLSGTIFQSLSRNALGSPEIIGLSAGAALGAVFGIVVLGTTAWATAGCAVLGCLGAAILTWLLTPRRLGGGARLVLVGLGVAAVLQPLTTVLLTRSSEDLAIASRQWLTGTLNGRDWTHVTLAGVALVILMPISTVLSRHLEAAAPGEALAGQLGVALGPLQWAATIVGVGLTAVGVAAAGPVSFISLAAPHIARRLLGGATAPMITSAGTGAALLTAADFVGLNLPGQLTAPVGVVAGAVGGIYLFALLGRKKEL